MFEPDKDGIYAPRLGLGDKKGLCLCCALRLSGAVVLRGFCTPTRGHLACFPASFWRGHFVCRGKVAQSVAIGNLANC